MRTSTTRTVLIADNGAVRTITLNRPHKRNAIDLQLRVALADAIEAADADDTVRAIILTGAGPVFCSGGDINTMERLAPDRAKARTDLAQRVIRAIWRTPKPVLAAVEGAAYGAGAALAAACDRLVAGRDAQFATTFTNVGLAGDMGAFASLPARVGQARARQMLLFPAPIAAPDALQLGLVDAVVDAGHALTAAHQDAEQLARGPAAAHGVIKALLAEANTSHPLDVLEREADRQAELFDTDDFMEGVAAFRGRRRPAFGARKGTRS